MFLRRKSKDLSHCTVNKTHSNLLKWHHADCYHSNQNIRKPHLIETHCFRSDWVLKKILRNEWSGVKSGHSSRFFFFPWSQNRYTSISKSWGRTSGCDCKPNTPSTEYSSPSPHHSSWILMVLHYCSWFLMAGLVRCLTPAHHQRCYSAMMGMVTFQSTNSWWGPIQQSTDFLKFTESLRKRVRTSMWPWWSLLPPASELQFKQH